MAFDPSAGNPQAGDDASGHPPRPAGAKSGGRPVAPAVPEASLNALALLKSLRRRWLLGLAVGLLLATVAGPVAWFLLPGKYTVRTLIHVPPPRTFVLPTAETRPDLLNHQKTQVAMLKSRLVLNAALNDKAVKALSIAAEQADPLAWLERGAQADFSVAPEVLRIAMSGDRPQELVVLVNALREAYLREIVERETNQRRERYNIVRGLREKFDNQMKASREEQKLIEQKAGAKDAGARALMLGYFQLQLGAVQRELVQYQADLRKAQLDLKQEREKEKHLEALPVADAEVDAQVEKLPAVQELVREEQKRREGIERTLADAALGKDDPLVKDRQEKLRQTQEALAAQRQKLRPEVVKELQRQARAVVSANIAVLQGKVAGLRSNVEVLEPEAARLRNLVQERAQHGANLDMFREEVAQTEALTRRLTQEETALEVELNAPKREQVLEPAVVAQGRTRSQQALMAAGAAAAGLALGLLAVAFWEFRARRVDTVEEVAHGLGLTVVGALPDPSKRVWRRLPGGVSSESYAQALLTESVDATRTMLLHAARLEAVQVVMVTSALPGEGKTSLSAHLAASLARVGLKTLLIDGDLRNPTAHRLFELPNEAGFSELLRGEADLAQVTQPTLLPDLALIPAGRWDARTAQALAKAGPRALFCRLRREYDFILVDSSPILPVADALLIGQSADAAIFSVLRDVSRLPDVQMARQRLAALGVRTLGAVVSGVSGRLYASAYTYAAPAAQPEKAS
jgi:capsular exopolysaccharide synthesis family protein